MTENWGPKLFFRKALKLKNISYKNIFATNEQYLLKYVSTWLWQKSQRRMCKETINTRATTDWEAKVCEFNTFETRFIEAESITNWFEMIEDGCEIKNVNKTKPQSEEIVYLEIFNKKTLLIKCIKTL